jgi:hypothetical protein
VTQNEIPSKVMKKDDPKPAIHNNFGKTPEYLLKYKHEAEMKKESEYE